VAETLREKAPAKVNLTLRIVGTRADGYHTLESLVAFADIADVLTLEPGAKPALDVAGPFAAACGPASDNLVLKAARAVSLKSGRFTLEKIIPVAAGLGGGSSDAAAALRLIARANRVPSDDARLRGAALACGADVPACLDPRAKVMRGIGEELSLPAGLPPLAAVLVNHGVALATKDVFAVFEMADAGKTGIDNMPCDLDALFSWLSGRGNDLTNAAIQRAPAIKDMLAELAALPGCRLARMSGSGATCFALFATDNESVAAATRLRGNHPDWWIRQATLR
jgi:4-diphosphocytidyl-2-C-methyl-D-erythritol kinase